MAQDETAGALSGLLDADPEAAWSVADRAAREVASRVRHASLFGIDRADLVQETLLRVFAADARSLRRVSNPEVPLTAWLHGIARRVVLESARNPDRRKPPAVVAGGRATTPPVRLSFMTQRQRRAWAWLREGLSKAEIARRLGIDRTTVRDRLARAARNGLLGPRRPGCPSRKWARRVLRRSGVPFGPVHRGIVLRLAAGNTLREIATEHGLTRSALRMRIYRLRRSAAGPVRVPPNGSALKREGGERRGGRSR